MVPEEVRLAPDRAGLAIRWPDGATHRLSAGLLRNHCRSASAVRGALDGAKPSSEVGAVHITRVETVGTYAINLAFSDGEERGIFPWAFLRSLGE
jgi:DUF971 family protein